MGKAIKKRVKSLEKQITALEKQFAAISKRVGKGGELQSIPKSKKKGAVVSDRASKVANIGESRQTATADAANAS